VYNRTVQKCTVRHTDFIPEKGNFYPQN